MRKLKTTEVPSHAKDLFIQLYCEKQGGETHENLHNAAQSWLSLSLTKKQHFYDTITTATAVKKAQLVIQTEPYLREKIPRKLMKQNIESVTGKEYLNNEKSDSEYSAPASLVQAVHDDTTMECDRNSFVEDYQVNEPEISDVQKQQQSYTSVIDEETDTADEFEDERNARKKIAKIKSVIRPQQPSLRSVAEEDEETDTADEFEDERKTEKVSLVEPILPIAKTGKELFELLKARNGVKVNKTYEDLTPQEKRFYGRAVTVIKKDYVKKYKEYLESLSSRQLFDYYKIIF